MLGWTIMLCTKPWGLPQMREEVWVETASLPPIWAPRNIIWLLSSVLSGGLQHRHECLASICISLTDLLGLGWCPVCLLLGILGTRHLFCLAHILGAGILFFRCDFALAHNESGLAVLLYVLSLCQL